MKACWLLLGLCLCICWQCSGAGSAAEIQKLRNELNAALEAGEEDTHGVVVQPTWTRKGVKTKTVSKVVVDQTVLKETSALRSEINRAVATQGNAQEVLALEAALQSKGSSQQTDNVGGARDELLGGSQLDKKNQPNVVDSKGADDQSNVNLAQLQRLELSKRRTREMLVLKRIVEDFAFTLGVDVEQWTHVHHNGSGYFVGRRRADLLFVQQRGDPAAGYKQIQTLPVPAPISAMVTFERWDSVAQLQEGLILLAAQAQLLWYRYNAAESGFAQDWSWPLGHPITSVTPFSLEETDYVAVASNRTLSIYAYDLATREFWIEQRLQLSQACTALAVLDTGRDLLLAVAQSDQALIYAYNPRELPADAGLHLVLRHSVDSPLIDNIAAFQMGGRSYLALGGQRPQILMYAQGELLARTMLGQNFGLVELFLPVPVRTYRDDLLLLVQHRVSFETHALVVLETLVWNGDAFEASVPAPCVLGPQTVHGVGCMLDPQRQLGLHGAALLPQAETPLLLVPRHEAESGLFRLHTELLPRNSELQDLQEIYDYMRRWLHEEDELLRQAEQLVASPTQFTTPLLINKGATVQALHINDVPWTTADAQVDVRQLLHDIRLLLGEETTPPRPKRQPQPQSLFHYDYEQLDVDEVDVEILSIDKLNGEPFYVQNGTLQFNGTLNVQDLELLQQPVTPNGMANASALQLQHLELSGDLACEYINGLPWAHFVQELVWRDQPLELSKLDVHGAIVFEQSLELSALNQLSFPSDYLWSNGNSTSIVQAPKHFTQTLQVNAVDTDGTVNGVNPLDAITLSEAQDWPGLVTFAQLEVAEGLELEGRAQGRQFDQTPPNPTLTESHRIRASCHFTQLIVNGPVRLQNELDGVSYDALIGDIAQRPANATAELLVPSAKHFDVVSLPVDTHVLDGAINEIAIERFVTKHTPQTLHQLNRLQGYVYFHELRLQDGLYDGVSLERLLGAALRIDAPLQALDTQLHFVDGLQLEPGAGLQVQQRLNGVPLATGYQTLDEPLHLARAGFERLGAPLADVASEVRGPGLLNGRNLAEQRTGEHVHVHVQELILVQGVRTGRLQGMNATLLLNVLEQLDELPLLILSGELQVARIAVSGTVQVNGPLNGRDLGQLEREVVWLQRPNELGTRWSFEEPPLLAADLQVLGTFNERLLPELVADIVFRDEATLIVGTKSFVRPVRVLGELQLDALNGVPCERLANKRRPMQLAGSLQVDGRLDVAELRLEGALNGQDWHLLEQRLRYDAELEAFVQRGMVTLPAQRRLANLSVLGHFGNCSELPLQQFFEQLVYRTQPLSQPQPQLQGHKIFTGRVSMPAGARVTELNGLPLAELLQQLIFVDAGDMATVQTPVRFEAPVHINELHVERLRLEQAQLNGCNVSEWLQETVRLDEPWRAEQPLTFAPGALDGNALQVRYVNELDLSRVLTLHTEQNLSAPLLCDELYLDGQLPVQQLVNGFDLSAEYGNTLLRHPLRGQVVSTPLIMQSLYVAGTLQVPAPVNGDPSLNLSDVAGLCEPQLQLQTPLYFAKLQTPHLHSQHSISGIDFADWHRRSLWARGRRLQLISGNWSVGHLRLAQPEHNVYRRRTMGDDLQALCARFAGLFHWLRLPYQVKQLARRFVLRQAADYAAIRRVFVLEADDDGQSYLLVNERACWTRIYRWNGTRYAQSGAFESGPVDEVTGLGKANDTSSRQLLFMTSYELSAGEDWNCKALDAMQTWRLGAADELIEPLNLPATMLTRLQQQQQQLTPPSIPRAIKYLKRPNTDSVLRPHLDAPASLSYGDYRALIGRLLDDLSFRLHTEVNITQLSIPESDLYDEHLLEDFLDLMQSLQQQQLYDPQTFASVSPATLPLPDNPARVLAARSVQLMWPVIAELEQLHAKLPGNESHAHELCVALKRTLGRAVRDVLLLANDHGTTGSNADADNTPQLHAVIARLRELQRRLQELLQEPEPLAAASSHNGVFVAPPPLAMARSRTVQTLRLYVGAAGHARLLYARLTLVAPGTPPLAPSSAPAAYIQLYYANGTLFQSLAAAHTARHLVTLRVRDETLLAFAEGCCRVRVLVYRGVQGFVPFAQFEEESDIVSMVAMRLPLSHAPGALYTLAVAQTRAIHFYELVVMGLFEPWLHCK